MTGRRENSPSGRLLRAVSFCLLLIAPALAVAAPSRLALAPYKDKLFSYGAILERNGDGSFMVVEYKEARDVDRRDTVPAVRVRRTYVDTAVHSRESRMTVEAEGRHIAVDMTGDLDNARFAVIFVHGRGGDRRLGSDDWSFGGNFNRLKNLAVRNGGAYIAPSVSSFATPGTADLAALIAHVAQRAPKARIVLSCASMGSFICWHLADDPAVVANLAGMVVLGGVSDPPYLSSAAFKADLPLLMTHGSLDPVYPWRKQKRVFDRIQEKRPQYPVRFVLFETGIHGTPIRMTDWRTALDWIFAVSRMH